MASDFALQKAAQAWCKPLTRSKTMDSDLAIAFAEIIDELLKKQVVTSYNNPFYPKLDYLDK